VSAFTPNFFIERGPWTVITFGSGAPVKAALTKIDGVSTKHTWKEQKSKETSGSVNTFSGTKYGHPKLTFTAADAADFDDLRALWDLMKPVPGVAGTGTPPAATPAPGQTFAIGSPPNKGDSSSSSSSTGNTVDNTSATKTTEKKDDPGPRPPTIAVDYPGLKWHDITACALEEWEGPTPTEENGLELVITIIPDKPAVKAGTGAMAAAPPAAPGSQFTSNAGASGASAAGAGGGAAPSAGAGGPQSITTNAQQSAAGT